MVVTLNGLFIHIYLRKLQQQLKLLTIQLHIS